MNACLALVVSQQQASLHRKIAPLDDTGFRDRLAKASLLPCDLALVGAWESGKEEIPAKLAAWLEVLAKTQGAWRVWRTIAVVNMDSSNDRSPSARTRAIGLWHSGAVGFPYS
jgi:hypothetical protein